MGVEKKLSVSAHMLIIRLPHVGVESSVHVPTILTSIDNWVDAVLSKIMYAEKQIENLALVFHPVVQIPSL